MRMLWSTVALAVLGSKKHQLPVAHSLYHSDIDMCLCNAPSAPGCQGGENIYQGNSPCSCVVPCVSGGQEINLCAATGYTDTENTGITFIPNIWKEAEVEQVFRFLSRRSV